MMPDHSRRAHNPALGLFGGLGESGRCVAAAMVDAEMADCLRGMPEPDLVFPASRLKPIQER